MGVQLPQPQSGLQTRANTLHNAVQGERLPREKHSKVVYRIPCDCGKVYISETTRRLETRLREHRDAHYKGNTETSAVAEHNWNTLYSIQWDDTTIVVQTRV